MKKVIKWMVVTLSVISCSDEAQLYCVTGVNTHGNRVGLSCVYKDKIEEVKGRDPDVVDFEVYEIDNCSECPIL